MVGLLGWGAFQNCRISWNDRWGLVQELMVVASVTRTSFHRISSGPKAMTCIGGRTAQGKHRAKYKVSGGVGHFIQWFLFSEIKTLEFFFIGIHQPLFSTPIALALINV